MKKYIVKITLLLLICTSCGDWLTIQPETMLPADKMFQKKEGFGDALIGVYVELQDTYSFGGPSVSEFVEHLACAWDNIKPESQQEKMNLHEYYELDPVYGSVFKSLYKNAANVNIILQYIENGVLDQANYNDTKGQALALRAYSHFDLIRFWGPVPGIGKPGQTYLPYADKIQINPYDYLTYTEYMKRLKADLDEAERLLEPKTNAVMELNKERHYLRYYGVVALQARIALWEGDKESALKYAQIVYDYAKKDITMRLGTVDNINKMDYGLSNEHIFRILQPSNTYTNLTMLLMYVRTLDKLYESEPNDFRYFQWIDKSSSNEADIPSRTITKYNLEEKKGDTEKKYINVPLIRLSEIYFILMECADLETANKIYEEFCRSRGVVFKPIENEYRRREVLMLEYRKEFIAEGQLFFAYKRWNVKDMPRCIRPCSPAAYQLPIPRRENDLNN